MSLQILVVDDEEMVAGSLRAFLEDEGMQVRSAGSAEEAVALVRSGAAFDVCIMDMRLPGMDGNAGIRTLHRMCPDLKFLIHTGSADYSMPQDLRIMGLADAHLFTKPLPDMTPLAEAVKTLVARH